MSETLKVVEPPESDEHLTPTGEEAQAAARREAEARAAPAEVLAAQEAAARREAEAELVRLRAELSQRRGISD